MRSSIPLRLALGCAVLLAGFLAVRELTDSEAPKPTDRDPAVAGSAASADETPAPSRTLRGPAEMDSEPIGRSPSETGSTNRPVRDLRRVRVTGRVVGPDLPPAPVVGASVSFRTAPAGALRFVAKTDEEGRFIARVPVGWRVEAVAQAEGFSPSPLGRYVRIEEDGLELGDVTLLRGRVFEGKVVAAGTGQGLGGAVVSVAGLSDSLRVVSDADGQFRFESLAPGRHRLEVSAGGFRSRPVEIDLSAEPSAESDTVVELWPQQILEVRAIDPDSGAWVAETRVASAPSSASEPVERFLAVTTPAPGALQSFMSEPAVSDAEAEVHRFEQLDTGRYLLQISARDRVTMQVRVDLPPTGDWPRVEVPLPRGEALVVRAFDASSQPLPEAWVSLYLESWTGRQSIARRRTDDDATVRFEGLPKGSYRATVQPPTGREDLAANSSELVDVPARSEVTVELLQPGRLEGEVTGSTDGPLFVVCTDGRSVYSLQQQRPGPFVIEGLGAGGYWLRALRSDGGESGRRSAMRRVRRELGRGERKPPFDLRIDAEGTTRAVVAVDPTKVGEHSIELSRDGRPVGPGTARVVDESGRSFPCVLDAAGRLRILDVPDGRYSLEVDPTARDEPFFRRPIQLPFASGVLELR